MSVTVTLASTPKERKPYLEIPWWVRPKYLIDIRVNKRWMAFRFCLANPLRLHYNRQVRKRHQKLKDALLASCEYGDLYGPNGRH